MTNVATHNITLQAYSLEDPVRHGRRNHYGHGVEPEIAPADALQPTSDPTLPAPMPLAHALSDGLLLHAAMLARP
jgi:hypothetical protein